MGHAKKKMMEDEAKAAKALDSKLKGYAKKIVLEEGSVTMNCPGCGYAWSKKDQQEKFCVHGCGFKLHFNIED